MEMFDFLGYVIDVKRVHIDHGKVDIIIKKTQAMQLY